MTSPIRILHTSDIHVGSDHGSSLTTWHGTDCLCTLKMVCRLAADQGCDLLIVAGDMFDNNRVPDTLVVAAIDILRRARIPCVIVPGNHDAMIRDSVYARACFNRREPSIRVATKPDGECLRFPPLQLTVFARPTVVHSPTYRPLADVPKRPARGWYVVAAHGHFIPDSTESKGAPARASPITLSDLSAVEADYVALGHWDVSCQVSDQPPAVYSGAPMLGGEAATAALVTLWPNRRPDVVACPLRQ